jgi:hypothetical protein
VPTNEWYPNPWFGIYPPDHSGGYVHTGKTNFT